MKHLIWLALCAVACAGDRTIYPDAFTLSDSVFLAVYNVGGHCSVTIGEGAPDDTETEQIIGDYRPGQNVSLHATARPGYTLGPWHHTTHDTGSGELASDTDITLGDEPGCAWICCGSGADDCQVPDPCR